MNPEDIIGTPEEIAEIMQIAEKLKIPDKTKKAKENENDMGEYAREKIMKHGPYGPPTPHIPWPFQIFDRSGSIPNTLTERFDPQLPTPWELATLGIKIPIMTTPLKYRLAKDPPKMIDKTKSVFHPNYIKTYQEALERIGKKETGTDDNKKDLEKIVEKKPEEPVKEKPEQKLSLTQRMAKALRNAFGMYILNVTATTTSHHPTHNPANEIIYREAKEEIEKPNENAKQKP